MDRYQIVFIENFDGMDRAVAILDRERDMATPIGTDDREQWGGDEYYLGYAHMYLKRLQDGDYGTADFFWMEYEDA